MKDSWKLELEEYIRQGEPDRQEKTAAWQTAIGLQAVDGLTPSDYLLETAVAHIQGDIDMPAAKGRIQSYYAHREDRRSVEKGTREADLVSVRVAEILGEKTFQFSPVTLQNIHRRLFSEVFDHAGQFRPYNITKNEWVLGGDTVIYAPYESIRETLDYDFQQEKNFSYQGLSLDRSVQHIARFTSDLWQIHPFCEGNTRSTAVFLILYLKTFGFRVNNDVFAENSWYFRNALVRANYNDLQKGVHATTVYLERFFENLLLGTRHPLRNRYLHLDYEETKTPDRETPTGETAPLACSLEELALLRLLKENPGMTQKALGEQTGKSERTIKRRMTELQEKGYIRRANGKRNGRWEILVEI